jgi:ATP-binding cassette, subfamily B, multidrug efflux pump
MSDPVNIKSIPAGLPGRRGKISGERPKNSRQVIFRLWKYLRRQKVLLWMIVGLLLINTSTTLAGSYLLRPIINQYILPHNIPGLIKMILLLLGIYFFGAGAAVFQNRLMIIVAQKTVSTYDLIYSAVYNLCH